MRNAIYLNRKNQNDNIYTDVKMEKTADYFGGKEVASKATNVILSNNKVVHFCSDTYGLLTNQEFFGKMERELIDEGIGYEMRSFNHNDSRFSVDFVLKDDSKVIVVNDQKNSGVDDTLVPMLRLTNSYDGSTKTAGHLGFFRKVCHNGLHMAETQLEFKVRHTKGNMELFIPNIEALVRRFLDNEFYSINEKIKRMKAHIIDENQIEQWIKDLAKQERVWVDNGEKRYLERLDKATKEGKDLSKVVGASESPNVGIVRDILLRDANNTGVEPNAWLVYSAFNEFIHSFEGRVFEKNKDVDTRVFNSVSELVY